MMRSMRAIYKPVFYVLTISFVGWLAYGQVTDILGGGRDVVLKVNGDIVRAPQFQQAVQAAAEQARRQGAGRLTREDDEQIQNQVADQFIQKLLLEHEYRRLGIQVSDDEIRQLARSTPPPQLLRQIMEDPTFQTNGQFDISKWQRYLTSAGEEFRTQVEQLYRDYLPEHKLEEYLTADVYISDAKLWRIWRDQHESVTVALLAIRPEPIPDSLAAVSDAELERYYAAHTADFTRPATAWLSFVALPRVPDAADSAAALAKARRLRAEILRGTAKFEDLAKKESADSGSGTRGGDLGWVKPKQSGFDPQFVAGMRGLKSGEVSEPVRSTFGYHLIKVDAAKGDSVHVRHILIGIVPQGKHLDAIDARTDSLDHLAAEQANGSRLDSAAQRLTLPVAQAPKLVAGERLTLGRYVIPDVSIWAFDAPVGETSPVIEGERAYYVFRLDTVYAAGTPPLGQIRDRVREAVRLEKKKELARQRATEALAALAGARDLVDAARAHGLPATKVGPFTRLNPPDELAREPLVLGVAFGLRSGQRSGLLAGQTGFFILQGLARQGADSAPWLKQRDRQRETLMRPAQQARVQLYIAALRTQANVVDRRKEVFRPTTTESGT